MESKKLYVGSQDMCNPCDFFLLSRGNNSNQYCQKNKHYILDVSGSFIRRYGKGLRREFIFLS